MPVWAGHAEDGSGRLFVAEQVGGIIVKLYFNTIFKSRED